MTNYARTERDALCDTLLSVGPDAPTLCSPWTSADLAAHLVLRETRPDLLAGLLVPPLAARLERATTALARSPWADLVDTVRHGPPFWSVTRIGPVDQAVNTVEFFVHHEDVLRAGEGWQPRALDRGHERALWSTVNRMGKLLARKVPTGLVVVSDGFGRAALRGPGPRGTVVLRGRPGEVLLFLYGRQRVAQVTLEGDARDTAVLREAHLGV